MVETATETQPGQTATPTQPAGGASQPSNGAGTQSAQPGGQPTSQPSVEEQVKAMLAKELDPFKRGVGQASAAMKRVQELEEELKKSRAPQAPTEYSKLEENDRKQLSNLIWEALQAHKDFAEPWQQTQKFRSEYGEIQTSSRVTNSVKNYLGESWNEEMENTCAEIVTNIKREAANGNSQAQALFKEIRETQSGFMILAELGKQAMAKRLAEQGAGAQLNQTKQIKRQAGAGGSAGPKIPLASPDSVESIQKQADAISDRKERIAFLAKHVKHTGEA
jgi:hypothetical protein